MDTPTNIASAGPIPLAACVAANGWQLLDALFHNKIFTDDSLGGFISPLSTFFALALALSGAGKDSLTHQQGLALLTHSAEGFPANTLHTEEALNEQLGHLRQLLKPGAGDPTELLIANSLWSTEVELSPAYINQMATIYEATAARAHSVKDINDWAEQATKGLIKQAVPPGTLFDAALVNAIYFKGMWEHKFEKTKTTEQPFKTGTGQSKAVPMMSQLFKTSNPGRPLQVAQSNGLYTAVRMPYQGGNFSAVAILPDEGKAPSQLLSASPTLAQLLDSSSWSKAPAVLVQMPRFKLESQVSIAHPVAAMGWPLAFQDNADFSRLCEAPLHISDIIHTAVVIVDEEGSEAAAVTAVTMTRSAAPMRAVVFDRPFLFMIVHDPTSTPLFLGVVQDPSRK